MTCPPTGALQAIDLDGTVHSAPAIEASNFPGGATISGSAYQPFTQQQARGMAAVLQYGSLPVRLVVEVVISTISPARGRS